MDDAVEPTFSSIVLEYTPDFQLLQVGEDTLTNTLAMNFLQSYADEEEDEDNEIAIDDDFDDSDDEDQWKDDCEN